MNINTSEKEIIELLSEFGLAANLGKTYVALLENNPATGYEICTQSGVPRSAIYSVLNKLEVLGIVNSIGPSPIFTITPIHNSTWVLIGQKHFFIMNWCPILNE